jgi:8-oxo-dGTP pyrophosphatase MutT (NUDIX family)
MCSRALSKNLFWLLSRTALAVYSRIPIFGSLKASLGVMQHENAFLVIHRDDGRGVSFPGGIQMPWESAQQALVREVREETGLHVTRSALSLQYYSNVDVPVNITVFEMEARGEMRDSWEGTPCWLPASDLHHSLIMSQRPILAIDGIHQ